MCNICILEWTNNVKDSEGVTCGSYRFSYIESSYNKILCVGEL